jgi:hypothetical protein
MDFFTKALHDIFLVLILAILLGTMATVLSSCATNPSRQFNTHDLEDYECYRDSAGRIGYCEK